MCSNKKSHRVILLIIGLIPYIGLFVVGVISILKSIKSHKNKFLNFFIVFMFMFMFCVACAYITLVPEYLLHTNKESIISIGLVYLLTIATSEIITLLLIRIQKITIK